MWDTSITATPTPLVFKQASLASMNWGQSYVRSAFVLQTKWHGDGGVNQNAQDLSRMKLCCIHVLEHDTTMKTSAVWQEHNKTYKHNVE